MYMLYLDMSCIYGYVYLMSRMYTVCKVPCLGLSRALKKGHDWNHALTDNLPFQIPKSVSMHLSMSSLDLCVAIVDCLILRKKSGLRSFSIVIWWSRNLKSRYTSSGWEVPTAGITGVCPSRAPQNQCFVLFPSNSIRFHHDFCDSTWFFWASLLVKLYAPFLDNLTGCWSITWSGPHFLSTDEMTKRTAFSKNEGRILQIHKAEQTLSSQFVVFVEPLKWRVGSGDRFLFAWDDLPY